MDTLPIAFVVAIVLVLALHTKRAIVWFIGLILVIFVAHFFKYTVTTVTHHAPWTLRPPNAPCNCDYGSPNPRPGFPSGHAAFAAYSILGLTWLFQSPIPALLGLPWMLYVGHQRIQSRCHTPLQVVAGYLLGVTSALALALYLYR